MILNISVSKYFKFFTSVFTLPELASAVYRRTKNEDKVYSTLYKLIKTWEPYITIVEPLVPKTYSRSVRRWFNYFVNKLITTTINYNTPSMDTFHAYIISEYKLDILVTWNKRDFKTLGDKLNIQVLTPNEFINCHIKQKLPRLYSELHEKLVKKNIE